MKNKTKKYCLEILTKSQCNQFPFHNVEHTKEVIQQANIIGKHLEISKEEEEIVEIAAWFHDTGFREKYNGHESISKAVAKQFLEEQNYPLELIEQVLLCIEATKMPQNPTTPLAEILCDADIYHISQPNFFYRKLLLRREWELVLNKYYKDVEWHRLNLQFIHVHKFFTTYGKEVLQKGKAVNEKK